MYNCYGDSVENIRLKIREIKKNNKFCITNFFDNIKTELELVEYYEEKNSITFVVNDNLVRRGYFYSSDYVELCDLLSECSKDTFFEIITKKQDDNMEKVLTDAGCQKYATFKRLSNGRVSDNLFLNIPMELANVNIEDYGKLACQDDLEEIVNILYQIFDPRTSHISTKNEIVKLIELGNIIVEKANDEIIAFLVYKTEGRKFYINQVFNKGSKQIIHCILMNAILNSMKNGVNYIYSWIDEKNQRSIRFHERYGLKFDGLMDISYIKVTNTIENEFK